MVAIMDMKTRTVDLVELNDLFLIYTTNLVNNSK